METSQLKKYAPEARDQFAEAISSKAAIYGLMPNEIFSMKEEGDVVVIGERAFPRSVARQREKLEERINQEGYEQFIDSVAYTWFNRLMAIRYMELHGYLDHGYRVLSHPDGESSPEILQNAERVELPGLDSDRVVDLKLDGGKDEELYQLLLLAQCSALHQALPFLFEPIGGADELLLPDNLLHTDSLVRNLVNEIPEESWQDIEIVGWLYQFYISEKKDQVIGKVVKSEDIPAATQLFTPNWIVKYMVQNSLGAQWLATYPQSPLKGQMEYYIEPAEQTDEVNAQLAAITPSQLNPEELTLIDPASGSGHILVEAYELFKAIYLERGYRQRDVPQLILEKNLFGLDIDERAAQLTGFALMMKGRADDRRLFERGVKLNVMALVDSAGFDAEALSKGLALSDYGLKLGDLTELKRLFEHATTFGSLIQVPEGLAASLPALKQLSEATSQDLLVLSEGIDDLGPLVQQAELLAAKYDTVVANPPYIGSKFHIPLLKDFLKDHYKGYEKDVFSSFIDRNLAFSKPRGRLGFMSPFVWMFISSYEYLRARLISQETIASLVQLEYSGFEGATVPVCTFTLQKGHVNGEKSCFIRLSDFRGSANQAPKTVEAIQNRRCGWFFQVAQDEFRKIPGSPIVYWVSEAFFNCFTLEKIANFAEGEGKNVTADNERFLRNNWEVSARSIGRDRKWLTYSKGGAFRKWSGNLDFVTNWSPDARAFYSSNNSSRIIAKEYWYRPGITWTDITSSGTGFRYLPEDTTYDTTGISFFLENDEGLFELLSAMNSKPCLGMLQVINPTLHANLADVKALPIPSFAPIEEFVGPRCVELSDGDWNAYERSWDFQSLPLLTASTEPTPTLESSYTAWTRANRDTIAEMKRLEEENNRLFIDAYGLADELTPDVPIEQITLTVNPAYRYGKKVSEEEQWTRFRQDTMEELVSYAIGCMMGRYSLDAPGLIYAHSGNEGFDPDKYTTFPADDDGIVPLTDTEWFDDDACNRFIEFVSVAWDKESLEENLTFLADNLKPKKTESSRDTLRRYLNDKFFKDHLKTYKKRPIYWLFSSGKQKAFQCLVYLHRYNGGTLSRIRTEYLVPLQGKINSRIDQLENDITTATSTSFRKTIERERDKLIKQRNEIQNFDEKLRHFADKRIEIDLDDGVKVNYGKFGDLLAEVKAVHGKKPNLEAFV